MNRRQYLAMVSRKRRKAQRERQYLSGERARLRDLGDAGIGLSRAEGAISATAYDSTLGSSPLASNESAPPRWQECQARNKGDASTARIQLATTVLVVDVAPLASSVPVGDEFVQACKRIGKPGGLSAAGATPGLTARQTRGKAPKRLGSAPTGKPSAPKVGRGSGGADCPRALALKTSPSVSVPSDRGVARHSPTSAPTGKGIQASGAGSRVLPGSRVTVQSVPSHIQRQSIRRWDHS